jgi:hypothetical protein
VAEVSASRGQVGHDRSQPLEPAESSAEALARRLAAVKRTEAPIEITGAPFSRR